MVPWHIGSPLMFRKGGHGFNLRWIQLCIVILSNWFVLICKYMCQLISSISLSSFKWGDMKELGYDVIKSIWLFCYYLFFCWRLLKNGGREEKKNADIQTSEAQRFAHRFAGDFIEFIAFLAIHLGGVYVGGRLVVRLGQHWHHWNKYFFNRLYGTPPLWAALVASWIVAGRMQYRNAHSSVGIY